MEIDLSQLPRIKAALPFSRKVFATWHRLDDAFSFLTASFFYEAFCYEGNRNIYGSISGVGPLRGAIK